MENHNVRIESADVWLPRLVACFLGFTAIGSLVAIVTIELHGREIPPILAAIAGGAITGLGSLLASHPLRRAG